MVRILGPFLGSSRFESESEHLSVWRNWIARTTSNRKVVGSNPITDIFFKLISVQAEIGPGQRIPESLYT